jgi:hypothetical protein
VGRWRFTPGRLDGKPVPVIVTVGVSFLMRASSPAGGVAPGRR